MNPLLEKNLSVLREQYPGLAARIEENAGDPGESHVETALSGDPALTINGIHIHSNRDPVREGRRQIEALNREGSGAFILFGFGLGYAAEAAAEAAKKERRPLVLVERRPELFRLALETRDLSGLFAPGTAVFVLGGDSGTVNGALGILDQAGVRNPLIVKNKALVSLSPDDQAWYADAERRVNAWASRDAINAATLRRFGRRWTKNLAANTGAIRDLPGVTGLARCLDKRLPVFLAAAGPSLDQAGAYLGEIRKRCLVVAVDTSLRFLLEAGCAPDFTVSVDPQFWNARHLHRLDLSCLVAESAVYPPVLRSGAFGRAFLCRSLFPLGRFIEDRTDPKGELGAGGSVATTAWDFARLLGPSSIWIAGLDLAFPGLKTHFRGALFEENAHAESGRFVPAETRSWLSLESGFPFPAASASGGTVLTDKRLSIYGTWFENRIGQEKETPNYSLSDGGLAVRGLVPASYGDVLRLPERRAELDGRLKTSFDALDAAFAGEQERRGQRYAAAVQSLADGLEAVCEQAEQARALALAGMRSGGGRILAELDRADRALAASPVKDAAGFLFPPASELEARLTEREPRRRHLELSSLLYGELAAAARFTRALLRKA